MIILIDVGSSNVNLKTVDCVVSYLVMPSGLGSQFVPLLEALYDINVAVKVKARSWCSCE